MLQGAFLDTLVAFAIIMSALIALHSSFLVYFARAANRKYYAFHSKHHRGNAATQLTAAPPLLAADTLEAGEQTKTIGAIIIQKYARGLIVVRAITRHRQETIAVTKLQAALRRRHARILWETVLRGRREHDAAQYAQRAWRRHIMRPSSQVFVKPTVIGAPAIMPTASLLEVVEEDRAIESAAEQTSEEVLHDAQLGGGDGLRTGAQEAAAHAGSLTPPPSPPPVMASPPLAADSASLPPLSLAEANSHSSDAQRHTRDRKGRRKGLTACMLPRYCWQPRRFSARVAPARCQPVAAPAPAPLVPSTLPKLHPAPVWEPSQANDKRGAPKFRRLPALLRWPNPQVLLIITFSTVLLNTSTAVIGAQVGIEYSMSDFAEDGWVLVLACAVAVMIVVWYVTQVYQLEQLRRKHNDAIWSDCDAPASVKDVDDPLFALMAKAGLGTTMRVKGEFGAPSKDAEEPARTERALAHALGCPRRWLRTLCCYDLTYCRRRLASASRVAAEVAEGAVNAVENATGLDMDNDGDVGRVANLAPKVRLGDALEELPAWLDEAKGGWGVHYLSVQLGLQLTLAVLTGFFAAHPWKLTDPGGMTLVSAIIVTQASSVAWCICNTSSDKLIAAQAATIYGMELVSTCLALAGELVAEDDLEQSLKLAVQASQILVWAAFVPMAITAYDNVVVPLIMLFLLRSEMGPLEALYLVITTAILTPVLIMQSLFGLGSDTSAVDSGAFEAACAMDMVFQDTAAVADEGGSVDEVK